MLESISWQEYFIVVGAVLVTYYAIATLLLYRREIVRFIKQRSTSEIISHDADDEMSSNDPIDLMGQVSPESVARLASYSLVESQDLQFAAQQAPGDEEVSQNPALPENTLAHTMSSLFHDIKAIAEVIPDNSKEEMSDMFKSLLERYPQLTAYREGLSQFIVNTCSQMCSYQIDTSEVNSWWPANLEQSK